MHRSLYILRNNEFDLKDKSKIRFILSVKYKENFTNLHIFVNIKAQYLKKKLT